MRTGSTTGLTTGPMMGLLAAIDEVADVDPAALVDGELHELVVGLERVESLFAGVRARLLSAWDARRSWADDGSKSAAARLARECQLSGVTARRELRRARKFRSMPHTTSALHEGKLSIDQADLLAHANQPELAALFARDEALLVDELKALRVPDGARVVRYWQHQGQDELDLEPWVRAEAGRYVSAVRTFDDHVSLAGLMSPVGGTVFLNELTRLEQQLFESDWKIARGERGPNALPENLPRTAGQRRADALESMARRSASLAEGAPMARPLVTVLAGYGAFSKMCELSDGTVVAPGQVVPLLGEADIERIVFEGPSRVIDVGQRRRFFTGALRRAIEVRDRHCQHPSGCDVPAECCQVDHIVPHSRGGLTTQENGRCYCKTHNGRKADQLEEPAERDPPDDHDPPDDG